MDLGVFLFTSIHMSISTFRTVHSMNAAVACVAIGEQRKKTGSAIPGFLNLGMVQSYVVYCALNIVEYLILKAPVLPSRLSRFSSCVRN